MQSKNASASKQQVNQQKQQAPAKAAVKTAWDLLKEKEEELSKMTPQKRFEMYEKCYTDPIFMKEISLLTRYIQTALDRSDDYDVLVKNLFEEAMDNLSQSKEYMAQALAMYQIIPASAIPNGLDHINYWDIKAGGGTMKKIEITMGRSDIFGNKLQAACETEEEIIRPKLLKANGVSSLLQLQREILKTALKEECDLTSKDYLRTFDLLLKNFNQKQLHIKEYALPPRTLFAFIIPRYTAKADMANARFLLGQVCFVTEDNNHLAQGCQLYKTDYYYSDKKAQAYYRFVRQNWYNKLYLDAGISELCFYGNMALHSFAFPHELGFFINGDNMNEAELEKHMKWNRYVYTEILNELVSAVPVVQFLAYNIDEAKAFNQNFFMYNLAQCRKYFETNRKKFGKAMTDEDVIAKQLENQQILAGLGKRMPQHQQVYEELNEKLVKLRSAGAAIKQSELDKLLGEFTDYKEEEKKEEVKKEYDVLSLESQTQQELDEDVVEDNPINPDPKKCSLAGYKLIRDEIVRNGFKLLSEVFGKDLAAEKLNPLNNLKAQLVKLEAEAKAHPDKFPYLAHIQHRLELVVAEIAAKQKK